MCIVRFCVGSIRSILKLKRQISGRSRIKKFEIEWPFINGCLQVRPVDYAFSRAKEGGFINPEKMLEIDNALRRVFAL